MLSMDYAPDPELWYRTKSPIATCLRPRRTATARRDGVDAPELEHDDEIAQASWFLKEAAEVAK